MAQQNLNFGTVADNDGETPYTAWPKVEANFTELYASAAAQVAALVAHEAAANPHPGYLTEAEADTMYADSAHSHTLDALTDVVITAPSSGQVIKFDGTNWVNGTDATGGGGLSDGDYGDIVVSSGSTVFTIDSGVLSAFGRTLINDTSAATARATLGVNTEYAATRTALKALDTTVITAAILGEVGREGAFVWKTGNYASLVTADSLGAIYLKADAIATTAGAWVRASWVSGGVASLGWFGCYPQGAATDVATEFEAALAGAAALGITRLIATRGNYRLIQAVIPAGTFHIDWNGSEIDADFNGTIPGATAGVFIATSGTATTDLSMENYTIDGNYDSGVTLTDESITQNYAGYRNLRLKNFVLKNCGKGGTTATLILDRENLHTRIHNCYNVEVDTAEFNANVLMEGLAVQSTDKRTRYRLANIRCIDHIGAGTPISVYNCGPGIIERCFIDGLTGSGMNILSDDCEIAYCTIQNISDSNGIDAYEGGIHYCHRAYIHNCFIDNIGAGSDGIGIRVAGNDVRVENNYLYRCRDGISVENNISGSGYPTLGSWLTQATTELSGIVIRGNYHLGHNAQSLGTNSNCIVLGQASFPISFEYHAGESEFPTTKTEYGLRMRFIRNAKITGKLMHGRTALAYISDTCGNITFEDVTFEAETGQTADHIMIDAGTTTLLRLNRCTMAGALDASYYSIARRTSGTLTEIRLDDSPTITDISVPANTRILRDGQIYIAPTPFTITGSLAGATRLTGTLTVSGVRTGIDEVIQCVSTSNNAIISDAYVSADNTVTITYRNGGETTVTDPSANLRITVGKRGYAV